ncbi:hypothetical protein JIN85_17180 [Luteolibacter pohnpeiensis]|uniref:Uncharacterized protein n=1 Tax=Luteolibacter pohnpeiensis TaxID=454153 RepID=A0A934S7K8_9BACT|nr:hypothetical protein [Luteolibacter pohnpeiensis]MBK1884156.1 hypothetical protein [Luteolibacter pohnpeiensis]
MNKYSISIFTTVVAIAAIAWTTIKPADAQSKNAFSSASVTPSIGARCLVTLDPSSESVAESTTQVNGPPQRFTIFGEFVRLDSDWVVLEDGKVEHWIDRRKILSMRVSK